MLRKLFALLITALLVSCQGQQSKLVQAKSILDFDHQFDSGSGIYVTELAHVQVENLVTLGRVWGFLKYYHPSITSGRRQWDYDLLRVLPAILEARDQSTANTVLLHWIDGLGPVAPCNPCAKLENRSLQFGPDLDWIADAPLLGPDLSRTLAFIRDKRLPRKQFYVSQVLNVGNPSFDHELSYPTIKFPDFGFQLLSLYRFWNIVEYWSPYRNLLGSDWTATLAEFIPRISLAKDARAYKLQLLALLAKFQDGHANLWSSLDVRPPTGDCEIPVKVRFVQGLPVITGFASPPAQGSETQLKVGDAITALDGVPVAKLIDQWKPYYAASNDSARLLDLARSMTRGACGISEIGILRDKAHLTFKVERVPHQKPNFNTYNHDLPGPTFRLLSRDVAYLKLSSVKASECPRYIDQAAGIRGLIIDIRNYPSEFVVFALGSLLVDHETPFALFTQGDLSNPGAFHWTIPVSLAPQKPHYSGEVVVLVDERSLSQAEFTAMAFRAARGAIVVGSQTAGADGNVSPFALPGGLQTMISGIGVFYPDKTPAQRIGIVPNVQVAPTIAGIRAGRDEVLEEAVRQIVGGTLSPSEIAKIAKR